MSVKKERCAGCVEEEPLVCFVGKVCSVGSVGFSGERDLFMLGN